MPQELEVLLHATTLTFLLLAVQGVMTPIFHGFKWGLGPRDEVREPTVLQGRANRIVANQIEAMVLFVPLILMVHVTEASSGITVTGAWIFLIGRMLFAIVYFLGIPVLRSLVWAVGVVGLIMIAAELFFAL
jgi:uncharacterized MAPEG superfamily protein